MAEITVHPVQQPTPYKSSLCPAIVTLKAYEVYCHLYGEQPAMVTDWCRGGFSCGELIGFLYARSFPKNEWRDRVKEAWNGMENL